MKYMPDRQYQFPDVIEGYPIESAKSMFSIVSPEATENLVSNPSPVLSTTGYSAMAGAISQSTTHQRRGQYSLRVAPSNATTDGAYFGTVTTATGWNTFSLDFWGFPKVPYRIYFASTAPAVLGTPVEFIGEGLWRRLEVKLYEAAGTTRRVYFTKNGSADTNYFYVDGLQVEAKDHSTTYADGSMIGFVPGQVAYYWTGARYGSSSIRIADTASGGRVVPLSDYSFKLLGHTGLGEPQINNIVFPYARVDGENYQTSRIAGRDFSLIGSITADNPMDFNQKRANLIAQLNPNRCVTRQPLLLYYQYLNDSDVAPTENLYEIKCYYVDGLSGVTSNKYQERLGINFRMPDPQITLDGVLATSLSYQTNSSGVGVLYRNSAGNWSGLFGAANGDVDKFLIGPDGMMYLGGTFLTLGGVANTKGVAKYDPATGAITALATGIDNGQVWDMAFDSSGSLYIVGSFTSVSGVANTSRIAKWSGGVWSALGTGAADGIALAISISPTDSIYVGGSFSLMGGVANTVRIAKWSGGVWSALGTGAARSAGNCVVDALIAVSDSEVYVGGEFETLNGVSIAGMGYWNGTTFVAMGTGISPNVAGTNAVRSLARDSIGNLYAAGNFTTMGGVTNTLNIARWNGSIWLPLSTGLVTSGGSGVLWNSLNFVESLLYVTGNFKDIDSNVYEAIWNGSSFVNAEFRSFNYTTTVGTSIRKDLYVGLRVAPPASIMAMSTVVNNTGDNPSSPILTFTGPGVVLEVTNYTTGKAIFMHLYLNDGETAILDVATGKITKFNGTVITDMSSSVKPGSSVADFNLAPGNNNISCFIIGDRTYVPVTEAPDTTAATTAIMSFKVSKAGVSV